MLKIYHHRLANIINAHIFIWKVYAKPHWDLKLLFFCAHPTIFAVVVVACSDNVSCFIHSIIIIIIISYHSVTLWYCCCWNFMRKVYLYYIYFLLLLLCRSISHYDKNRDKFIDDCIWMYCLMLKRDIFLECCGGRRVVYSWEGSSWDLMSF